MDNINDIDRIKMQEYKSRLDKVLLAAVVPVQEVLYELMRQDFPHFLAELFRIPQGSYPILERRILLSQGLNEKASVYLQSANILTEDDLNLASNDDLLPAVIQYFESIDGNELDAVARTILGNLDISATNKALRFIDNGIFLEQLSKQYLVNRGSIEKVLRNVTNMRNDVSHWSYANFERIDPHVVIQSADDLVSIFRSDNRPHIRQKVDRYFQNSRQIRSHLMAPMIEIEHFETKHNLPRGVLRKSLQQISAYRQLMDSNCTVLLFTPEEELMQLIANQALQKEIKTKPENSLKHPKISPLPAPRYLAQYEAGILKPEQTQELVNFFSILIDAKTLLTETGLAVLNRLGPVLKQEKRTIQIDWASMIHIYRTKTESHEANLRAIANKAIMQIYFMYRNGYIRYVGTTDSTSNPKESLVSLIRNNPNIPVCVISSDNDLCELLHQPETPRCLCLRPIISKDPALYPSDRALPRFRELIGSLHIPSNRKSINSAPTPKDTSPPNTQVSASVKNELPQSRSAVFDEDGKIVTLLDIIGQPGGEGTVYYTDADGLAAKIYHADQLSKHRQDKLVAMRQLHPNIPNVCWPKSLLYDKNHQFIGFLMTVAPSDSIELGLSVMKLNKPTFIKAVMPNWDRSSIVSSCITVAETFARLHSHNILVGDVNPRNILVSKSDPVSVFFVDCDSYQIQDFNCSVGMAEYSSPEILRKVETTPGGYAVCRRSITDEQFSLATLLFKMLMLGQSPFAAKNNENIADAVRDYQFAYKNDDDPGYNAPKGPYTMIWSNTPKFLKDMFANVFLGKKSYTACEWKIKLITYSHKIQDSTYTRKLVPTKYPDFENNMFADFTCDECKVETNMPIDLFHKLENKPKFCKNCRDLLLRAKRTTQDITCDCCGKTHTATGYDKMMQEHNQPWYCDKCLSRTCGRCHRVFQAQHWQLTKLISGQYRSLYCPKCRTKEGAE